MTKGLELTDKLACSCISRNLLTHLSKHYQTEGLAQPSKKSGGRRSNTRSLKYQDTEAVKKFICHYAEDHAVSLPGRVPGFKREDIRLLPSAIPKSGIYRQYADHANQAGLRVVGASTFRQLWLELCPYIVVAKPMTDLCWRCQRNNGRIFRGTFITDEEKNELILEQQRHLSQVNGERQLYQQMTAEAKERCFRRQDDVSSLDDLARTVELSTPTSRVNIPQLVGREDGTVMVPTYNWQEYLTPAYKQLKNIKPVGHFRFTATNPGVVFYKTTIADEEQQFQHSVPDPYAALAPMPALIPPPLLSHARRQYLFNSIRQYVRENVQDIVCPDPGQHHDGDGNVM
ncbi:hypothetical protein ACOMHN_029822 [Nucella lapillus]